MTRLGHPNWYSTLPWRDVLSLLWFDLASEIPLSKRDEWAEWWDSPLDDVATGPSDELLQEMFIDTGQAVDLVDARERWKHQQAVAAETDPLKRAALNATFIEKLQARRAETAVTDDNDP